MKFRKNKLRVLIPIFIFLFGVITCVSINFTVENRISDSNQDSNKINEIPCPATNSMWYRIWGHNATDSFDMGRNVAYDSEGNYYIVGDSLNSKNIAFLVKYDANGNYQWDEIWCGENGYPVCYDVTLDSSDNIYVTGTIKYGGIYVVNTLKFDKTGDLKWNSTIGGDFESGGKGIAIGNDDYLYVTGFNNTIANPTVVVLLKYNMTTGDIEDLRSYSGFGSTSCSGQDIAIDLSNNIYISGKNSSGAGNNEILLLKINSTMDLNWSRSWKNPYKGIHINEGYGIDIDSKGDIYIVGLYESHDYWPDNYHDGVFLKYNDTGDLIFEKVLHNQYNNTGLSDIYIFQDGIYVCGFEGDFDSSNAIILKYNTTGDLKEKKSWGGNDYDSSLGITVRNPSEIVIVGRTYSYAIGFAPDAFILKYYTAGAIPSGDDDNNDDDDKDGIIPGYDIYLIIILITFISSIYLHKKLKK